MVGGYSGTKERRNNERKFCPLQNKDEPYPYVLEKTRLTALDPIQCVSNLLTQLHYWFIRDTIYSHTESGNSSQVLLTLRRENADVHRWLHAVVDYSASQLLER